MAPNLPSGRGPWIRRHVLTQFLLKTKSGCGPTLRSSFLLIHLGKVKQVRKAIAKEAEQWPRLGGPPSPKVPEPLVVRQ
jgi:hypothetical protein